MMQTFDPQTLTIAQLFGNRDSLYRIPRYQRPYKWESEQVEQLWEDIYSAYQDNIANYFLGSIITAKDKNSIDVIDGQQRMTTLMILFCVIRDIYPGINSDSETINAITCSDIEIIGISISFNDLTGIFKTAPVPCSILSFCLLTPE